MSLKNTAAPTTPSAELIEAALALFAARALVETLRPVVAEIQHNLLREHSVIYVSRFAAEFPDRFPEEDRRPKRLTSFDDASELPDEQREYLFRLLEAAYNKAGFIEDRPVGHCPLLQARSFERRAADVFIEASAGLGGQFAETVKILDRAAPDKRDRYVELALRFVGQFVSPEAGKTFLR